MIGAQWTTDFVGVPYRPGGRDRDGWDCWGLVLAVYRERLGLELPDWQWQEPFGLSAKLAAFGAAEAETIEGALAQRLAAPEPWAIGLIGRRGRPHHVGVAIGAAIGLDVLHAQRYCGTVAEPRRRFARHYPEVTWWRWQCRRA